MARDEWYRRQNWTENDRREFFEHLARSRSKSHKAQYVRIQAFHLAEVGEIHGAIGLLQHLFAELPESSELAAAHAQMAECLIALGRTDDALNEYRAALLAEKNLPNVRTRAWLQFPWVVATTGMRHLYTEARSFLEWGERQATFPIDEYKLATVEAFMAADEGKFDSAKRFARIALSAAQCTHSGFRYHPRFGLVMSQQAEIKQRLEKLAK